jgi:dolichol-phosphate mannosyltransferase
VVGTADAPSATMKRPSRTGGGGEAEDAAPVTDTRPALRVMAASIAHNEASKIGRVIERFPPGLVDRIVVVDDASTDETPAVAAQKGAVVVTHTRRSGAGAAIRTAIKYATAEGFDVLVVLAGNDKDRPAEIVRLLAPMAEAGYDFVQGSRYLAGGDFGNMPFYRQLATRYVHPLLFSLFVGRRFTDTTNGFRAIRLSALRDARIDIDQPWLDHYELEPYLFFKMNRLGYRVTEVPVTKIYPPHELGYTKMKPITGWWSILRPLLLLGLHIKR